MDDHTLKLFFHNTLDEAFNLSDNPLQCADYFTHQIYKLVGAKSVFIVIQNENNFNRIFSKYPLNQEEWINQHKFREFIDSSLKNNQSQIWNKNNENTGIVNSLNYLKIENVISIPLISAGNNIGSVFLIDIAKKNNIEEMMTLILKLAGVLALLIRNSILSSNLEKAVESKTAELRKRNKELEESETKYRKLVENSPDAIAIYTAKELVFVNKICLHLTGATSEDELLGKSVMEFVHPDSRQFVAERMKDALLNHKILPLAEEKFIRLDGTACDVDVKAIPVTFEGQPAVQIIVRDISERKKTENALAENEEKFRKIFENSSTGKSMTSFNGVLKANKAYCDMLGYSVEELNSINWKTLTHKDDIEFDQEKANLLLSGEKEFDNWEKRYIHKDGHIVWVNITTTIVRDTNGKPLFFNAEFIDITKRKQAENELRENKDRLDRAEFASKSGNWEIILESGKVKSSKGAAIIYGLDRDEFTLENIKKIPLPAFRPLLDQALKNLIEKDIPYIVDFKIKKADTGEIRDIHSSAVYDADRNVVFGIIQDITERKSAERALQESEDRFKILFEKAPDAMFLAEMETKKIVDANEAACYLFKKRKNELIGLYNHELHPQKIASKSKKDFEIHIQTQHNGNLLPIENTIITSDEIEIPVEILGQAIKIGERDLLLGTFRDISERKKAEKILQETRAILLAAMDNSQAGIAIADAPDGRLRYVNEAGLFMRGEEKDKLVDNIDINEYVSTWQLLDLDGRELRPDEVPLARAIMFGEKNNREFIIRNKNNEDVIVLGKASPIRNEKDEVIAAVVVFQDITERKLYEEKLYKSEHMLKTVLDNFPGTIFWKDLNSVYLGSNLEFAINAGLKNAEELIGLTDFDLPWEKTEAAKYREDDAYVMKNNQSKLHIIETLRKFDSSEIWIDTSKMPLIDKDNKVIGVVGVFTDITDKKKAEDALRESEEKYRLLLENSGLGVGVYTVDGRVILYNQKALKNMGGNAEDYIGKSIFEIFDEQSANVYFKRIQDAIISERTIEYEDFIPLPSGDYWFLSAFTKIKNEKGEVIAIQIISHDITERKKAEKALQKSEKKLSMLFESMNEMVVMHELILDDMTNPIDYRILDCNNAFTIITGIDRKDAVGKLATEVYQTPVAPYIHEYANVVITGESYEFDSYFEPMDKHFIISAVSLGENMFATIATDISEIQNAQKELREKNKELENYIYVASHDLRSPLVNIQGFGQRLEKQTEKLNSIIANGALDETKKQEIKKITLDDVPKSLNFILNNVTKMDTLIGGLLQLSRTGRIVLGVKEVDMNKLIHDVTKSLNFQLMECNATLNIEHLTNCFGDVNQLNQVFSNIIGNAIKYRDSNRKLKIEITSNIEMKRVEYSIKDNGIGINERQLEKIWDIFYRVDATTPEAGEGLGLSLARRIVEKHKGKIWAESKINVGSVFHIELQRNQFEL